MVTHASMIDEGSTPVVTSGVVDADALRKRNHARLDGDRSTVTVLAGTDAVDLGTRICDAVVPKRPPATPVLIKPNIGGFDWFKDPKTHDGDDGVRGRTTNPEFVRGIIRCLKKRGHTKITVTEGWGATHKDWEKLVEVGGFAKMTKEEGVPLLALDDDGVFDTMEGTPGKMFAVRGMEKTTVPTHVMPQLLAEHLGGKGLFISAPKIKAHRFAVFSIGIKATQGTIAYSDASPAFRQKWRTHRELNPWLDAHTKGKPDDRKQYVSALETFADRIADVLEVEAPDVVLADGTPAEGGDGFQKLYPLPDQFAVGGTNVVLVDRIASEMLGFWDNAELAKELGGHKTSPLLEVAAKRFSIDLGPRPPLAGDAEKLLAKSRPVHFDAMAPFSIHHDLRSEMHAALLGSDAITIDGVATDAAWTRAPAQTFLGDWSGAPTKTATKARAVWSKDALYMLFELENAGLNTDTTKSTAVDREKLYEEDCVEIFVTPDGKKPTRYAEIEIGPYGHFLDLVVDAKKGDVSFSSVPTIATTRDASKRTAIIEVRLAAPEIVSMFTGGTRLPFAMYRMEGTAPRQFLAWSPTHTKTPDFHVPEAFGILVLDP